MSHVTLRDMTKKADVSATTVSRALNNKPDISPKTKNKILRIAKNLGYAPKLSAKSLRSPMMYLLWDMMILNLPLS